VVDARVVQNATCKCPGYPTAAGGTDGFYGLDANATHMMGLYNQMGIAGNELTFTSDGGKTWKLKKFTDPAASFNWNLYPVNGGKARRNFAAISQGAFFHATLGNMTDRSWTGKHSATFSFDDADELQMEVTGPVTVGPFPQPVNNTNGIKAGTVAPQFYGGPITLPDGSMLGTVGVYWSKNDPLAPTPDGPYHRMSIVAIRSTDAGDNWRYHGMVANASGPGGYPTSAFGPDENDVAVLGDGKTLLCVIRMDGDSGCSTKSYRYYATIYSHDMGATWGRAVRHPPCPPLPCPAPPCPVLGCPACVPACVPACLPPETATVLWCSPSTCNWGRAHTAGADPWGWLRAPTATQARWRAIDPLRRPPLRGRH
jgi:hypothetical protein